MKSSIVTLVANWKMHGNQAQVRSFAYAVNTMMQSASPNVRVVFCPPAIYLETTRASLPQNAQIKIGAQNCSAHAQGAFTGEISPAMLADCGARYVIIGHSERRAQHGETDAIVLEKAQAAAAVGLIPILCVGESATEYEAKQTTAVLSKQLQGVAAQPIAGLIVAYEPVWAIGSGKTPSMLEIAAAHAHIKSILGSAQTVLYGGSVKPSNISDILAITEVNGALIGGASLEIAGMQTMIAAVN
ncbi:MAG: triose-phosphate isomerase [Rhodospirillales bacterium 12-54-5]|nr:MAG: triose-phosphate isomerase [Rhodospirillales bacterium 12-54-5]